MFLIICTTGRLEQLFQAWDGVLRRVSLRENSTVRARARARPSLCGARARALAPRLAAFFQKRFKAGRMPRPTRPSSIMALPSTTGDPHPDTRGGVGGPTGPRRWPREPRHRLSAIMGPPLYDATKQHDRASCA